MALNDVCTLKWQTLKDWQNSLETSSRCFENQPNKICSHSYFEDSFWPKKLLDAKGPCGDNIIKSPARCISPFLPRFQV